MIWAILTYIGTELGGRTSEQNLELSLGTPVFLPHSGRHRHFGYSLVCL